ncbi:hypothetical protein B0H13DRAFT_2328509 [Mycena leptocephala]|nr:hypothetical protein B0H13DRAFT_2328509 [Mycena leptocephala]
MINIFALSSLVLATLHMAVAPASAHGYVDHPPSRSGLAFVPEVGICVRNYLDVQALNIATFADSNHRCPAIPVHPAPHLPFRPPLPFTTNHLETIFVPACRNNASAAHPQTYKPSLPSVPTASKRDHDVPFGPSQALWLPAAHGLKRAVPTFSPSTGITRSPSSLWRLSVRQGRTLKILYPATRCPRSGAFKRPQP